MWPGKAVSLQVKFKQKKTDALLNVTEENCVMWTYGQVWWPILGICALHLTHPSAHTQQWTHTHTRSSGQPCCCGTGGAVEGSVLKALAQGSHLSRGIEGGRERWLFTPPTIPAGPETRTCDLRVTSLTLYPLGHDCPLKLWGQLLPPPIMS